MTAKGRCSGFTAVLALGAVVLGGGFAAPARAADLPTATSITVSANPAAAGKGVTITVTVSEPILSPLGLVQIFDNGLPVGGPLTLIPDFDSISHVCSGCVPTNHSSASTTRAFGVGTQALTASYFFGDDLPSVGGPVLLDVEPAVSATVVRTSADPSVHGQPVTFTAEVASTGEAPSGTVQFKVDGADEGAPQTLDGTGHASIVASDLAVGSHPVSADFTSDNPDVQSSSGNLIFGTVFLPQIVKAADTATTLASSSNPSEFGAPVTFHASVAVVAPGGGTPTGTVQFQADGVDAGAPVPLDGSGSALFSTSMLTVGSHTITATYASDTGNFNGSSGALDQTVDAARTTVVYTGDTTADFDDPATLSARLVRADNGSPIPGEEIAFTMAAESCGATTDASGSASCTVTPSEAAATYSVAASFAGDTDFKASSVGEPFVVTKEETMTAYVGPIAVLAGHPVTLVGQLLEDGTKAIVGRTLTLTLGSGTTAESCVTGATDLSGRGSCSVPATIALGPQPLRAEFAGDAYYLSSSDVSKTAIVFAFPSRGAFVIGGPTTGTAVTFWGSNWSSLNPLSGGDAPSAFKGFAASLATSPPMCNGTWTTGPGNSPAPVGTLPTYMGTLVASSVRNSGSTISGNIVSIVVVATGAGYAPDPGHAGTGTVVATYC
jgi:hypothetical protein